MGFNFPDVPTIGQVFGSWTWDGEKWLSTGVSANAVRYDIAQGLTSAQMAQARSNIAVTKKNYVINGAMMISQENGGANLTANAAFAADQFQFIFSSATGTMNSAQSASVTPAGSPARYRFAANPVNSSLGSAEYMFVRTSLEGLRVADLLYGSASAKTTTLQFGVKAPAGTYCTCIRNGALNRVYIAEYTIAAGESLTDVIKSVIIPGDTTGTWTKDNTAGIYVDWIVAAGAGLKGGAVGSWFTGPGAVASNNQFNGIAVTSGFELFDVSLTEGPVAPPFQVPDYASELALCKRYWQKLGGTISGDIVVAAYGLAGATIAAPVSYPVEMRANPTAIIVGAWSGSNIGPITVNGAGTRSLSLQATASAASSAYFYTNGTSTFVTLNARL